MFPNNNPLFVDKLVHAKQEDIRREMEKACSLKDAGLSNPNWLVGQVRALDRWLMARGEKRQEHQASQTIDRKLTA